MIQQQQINLGTRISHHQQRENGQKTHSPKDSLEVMKISHNNFQLSLMHKHIS